MFRKVIKYKDLDGNDTEKAFYFNLTKPEILEMTASYGTSLPELLRRLTEEMSQEEVLSIFKDIIKLSYGNRDDDVFIKDDAVFKRFTFHPAYEVLYMELATNTDAATEFIIGIIPEDLRGTAAEQMKSTLPPPPPPAAA